MKPIVPDPRTGAEAVVFGASQSQYLPLPANVVGPYVETKWRLTLQERLTLLFTGQLYLTLKTFGQKLQPIRCSVIRDGRLD